MKTFLLAVFSVALLSFANAEPPASISEVAGTYGVCVNNTYTESGKYLKLNEDQTFKFVDQSDGENIVKVTGQWSLDGNKIRLSGFDQDISISDTWKMDKNYPCLKSRKGFEFTRLCECDC